MDRIALIADIHANWPALQEVLADIRGRGIERIYCLGDLVGYAPYPNQVIAALREQGIPALLGNYDDAIGFNRLVCGCDFPNEKARLEGEASLTWTKTHTSEENKAFLRSLPRELGLQAGGQQIVLVHGSPRSLNEYLTEEAPDTLLEEMLDLSGAGVLVAGHTHRPFYRRLGNRMVINAGSVGRPKHGDPQALYAMLTAADQVEVEFIKVPYDYEAVAQAILAAGLPTAFADLIRTGRG